MPTRNQTPFSGMSAFKLFNSIHGLTMRDDAKRSSGSISILIENQIKTFLSLSSFIFVLPPSVLLNFSLLPFELEEKKSRANEI